MMAVVSSRAVMLWVPLGAARAAWQYRRDGEHGFGLVAPALVDWWAFSADAKRLRAMLSAIGFMREFSHYRRAHRDEFFAWRASIAVLCAAAGDQKDFEKAGEQMQAAFKRFQKSCRARVALH